MASDVQASRPLTRQQTQAFLAELQKVHFWSLPSHVNDQTGTDGSQWIVEGAKDGNYHVGSKRVMPCVLVPCSPSITPMRRQVRRHPGNAGSSINTNTSTG